MAPAAQDLQSNWAPQYTQQIQSIRSQCPIASHFTSHTIARFLAAQHGNLEAAQDQLEAHWQWRLSMGIENTPLPPSVISLTPMRGYECTPDADVDYDGWLARHDVDTPTALDMDKAKMSDLFTVPGIKEVKTLYHAHGGGCYHKFDRKGRPVYIELAGRHDAVALAKRNHRMALLFHEIGNEMLLTRLLPECQRRFPEHKPDQINCVEVHVPAMQLLRLFSAADQQNYPEILGALYVVNAPFVFTGIWKMMTAFLDQKIIDSVRVLGKHEMHLLLEDIDAENLPVFLGGQCRCAHMKHGCVPRPKDFIAEPEPEIVDAVDAGVNQWEFPW